MSDHFDDHVAGLVSPAAGGFAITPDDDTDLAQVTRAIYVGVGGSLHVEMKWGGTVTFNNVADGALLPIRASKVLGDSSASALVGLY